MLPHRPYYDSIWFVTRTRHSRSNLLNRIFITRGRRTVYSSSAWLIKEAVHPLPSHYNKNKHSLRGFISASGAMLILYQPKRIAESEIMGFEDFESILVHCQERIRVMVEANQNGEPLTPDEVSFLNTLNDSVCALVDALKNDNGILRVTSARQYSNVITAFVDAIRESEN